MVQYIQNYSSSSTQEVKKRVVQSLVQYIQSHNYSSSSTQEARRKPNSGLYNHWFSTHKAKTTPAVARRKPKSGLYNHWFSTYKAKTTPAVARRKPKSGLYNQWFSTYKARTTPSKHAGSQTAGCTIIGSVHTRLKRVVQKGCTKGLYKKGCTKGLYIRVVQSVVQYSQGQKADHTLRAHNELSREIKKKLLRRQTRYVHNEFLICCKKIRTCKEIEF